MTLDIKVGDLIIARVLGKSYYGVVVDKNKLFYSFVWSERTTELFTIPRKLSLAETHMRFSTYSVSNVGYDSPWEHHTNE